VTTTEGPLLVLAGAGTGKTRVVTVRIAHLLGQGVPASAILAMTFTNKAAREMRQRLSGLVGREAAAELTVGTFHSFCARSLREHGAFLGLGPDFSICDAGDQLSTVKAALRDLKVAEARLHPGKAQARISLLKNRLVSADECLAAAVDERDELLGLVYARYDELLRRSRALDFDDLLLFMRRLLAEHAPVRKRFQERYRYLLVDEYQDTNGAQYEIVRLIGSKHRNVCVVGDDDQSIYGWRGADVARILNFEADFPGAAVVRLQTNYRSTEPILAAANAVIRNNPQRHEKSLQAAVSGGQSPTVMRLDDETAEAEYVVRDLLSRVTRGDLKAGDIGILYRTQQQPRPLESALRAARVPYVLVGGMSFFDRKEVRDVLAYVKLLCHPDDEASLLRIVNRPARGVGATSVNSVLALATERGLGVGPAFDAAAAEGLLSKPAAAGVKELRATLAHHARLPEGRQLVPHLGSLLSAVTYRAEVERCYPDERTRSDRWAGVLEVLDLAENYVSRVAQPSLPDFLERLTLSAGDDTTSEQSDRRDAVTLMTLHAAKGLEFPHVYLVGAEEGLLPHQRAVDEDTVEEERRLMYVGITRARVRLTLTFAASRSRWGKRAESMPSRFLYELAGETPPESWRAATPRETEEAPGAGAVPARRRKAAPAPPAQDEPPAPRGRAANKPAAKRPAAKKRAATKRAAKAATPRKRKAAKRTVTTAASVRGKSARKAARKPRRK
jgi:DNA helicase-2/ATP-dependent DNA helicase PcrA